MGRQRCKEWESYSMWKKVSYLFAGILLLLSGVLAILPITVFADDDFRATITSTPTEPTIDTTPTFEFTTTYDESAFTFACFIDNLSIGDCTSPFTISALEPGEHTFSVALRDNFTNFSPVDSHTWTINTEAQGDGSPEYPLGITNCQQLQDIDNDLSAAYKLLNDIDCSGVTNFQPIGTDLQPFTGSLNGNGYVVSNLEIIVDVLLSTGLFSATENANITALRLKDSVISNTYLSGNYSIGGIVGVAIDSSLQDITTDNVTVLATDNGSSSYTGGLAGAAIGGSSIVDSYFNGSVEGLNNGTGGLTGFLTDTSSVTSSYSEGVISAEANVGGLVGAMNETASIVDSYTVMVFDGAPEYSGGLVGVAQDSSDIYSSFSVADMSAIPVGPLHIGGIIGYAGNTTGTVSNTYFDQVEAGRSDCKGDGTLSFSCTTTTNPSFFLGNDTNGPLSEWNQGSPWNLHEEGKLPSFAIGRVACDDPPTQSESTLLFGCEWARETIHHFSGAQVSQQFRYREQGGDSPDWTEQNWPLNSAKVLILGLKPSTQYEVQFHSYWTIGSSDWESDTAILTTGNSTIDSDGDGIPDSVELGGPNYGDANGDAQGNNYSSGVDSQQANVTSFKNTLTDNYVVLQSDCSANSGLSISSESTEHKDGSYDFGLGLISFTASGCGPTATFTQYFYGDHDASKYIARKYNPSTHEYTNIPGAILSNVSINGQNVLKIVYQIADNGPLDDNKTTGTIVDPSGPALSVAGVPNTGIEYQPSNLDLLPLIYVGLFTLLMINALPVTITKKNR